MAEQKLTAEQRAWLEQSTLGDIPAIRAALAEIDAQAEDIEGRRVAHDLLVRSVKQLEAERDALKRTFAELNEDLFQVKAGALTYDIGWYKDHFMCRVIRDDDWEIAVEEYSTPVAAAAFSWLQQKLHGVLAEIDALKKWPRPKEFDICPVCLTEFGYEDSRMTHEKLRELRGDKRIATLEAERDALRARIKELDEHLRSRHQCEFASPMPDLEPL